MVCILHILPVHLSSPGLDLQILCDALPPQKHPHTCSLVDPSEGLSVYLSIYLSIYLQVQNVGSEFMHTRSVQKVSSHVLWKIETFIEEDTRYKKHCTQDNDTSVPFKVGTLGLHTVLPIAISCHIVFSWISFTVWNLCLFKGDFSFGKNQKSQGTKSGISGGWVTWVIWCFTKKLCARCDAWVGMLSWWSCQSPIDHSCRILNDLNRFCGGMFKVNAKFGEDSLLYLLSHFECHSCTVHMLTQQRLPLPLTSTVKSSLFVVHDGHSSPFSLAVRLHRSCTNHFCYINNGWTFSRPHTWTHIYYTWS